MNEFSRIVTHARRLKANVKDLSIDQLRDVQIKLSNIIDSRVEDEEKVLQQQAEKLEKISKYRELLAADGIELDELQGDFEVTSKKRLPRKPKYEIYTESGERITWTGQGRMPNIIKNCLDHGDSLETFLID